MKLNLANLVALWTIDVLKKIQQIGRIPCCCCECTVQGIEMLSSEVPSHIWDGCDVLRHDSLIFVESKSKTANIDPRALLARHSHLFKT